MSRRRQHSTAEAPGNDSFLDVVANLVGILLILIMVVGTQAKNAFVAAIDRAPPASTEPTKLEREVAAAEAAASAVERDFQNLSEKIARQKFEVEYRHLERDRLATAVAAAQKVLEQRRSELSAAEQEQFDLYAQLNTARRELRDLRLARDAALNTAATPGIIEHLPTPLAKTVFGKELHLQLRHGKVAFVPLNEFVAQLKEDAPKNSWKLKDADRITETLGPLEGFRMKYTLAKTSKIVQTQAGAARGSYVELERFILIPLSDDMGEPIETALEPGSGLQWILKEYPSDRTTVTVWVYPDSFEEFRKLKAELFKLGYSTAGRPLPEGHPIGGSPEGSHSAAQ